MKQMIRVLAVFLLAVTVTFGIGSLPGRTFSIFSIPTPEKTVDKLLGYFDGGQTEYYSCRKGSLLSANFSLRSFDGQLCNQSSTISAVAEAICRPKNVEGFIDSKCDQAALKNLGADPSNVQDKAKDVLVASVTNAPGKVAKLACKTIASFIPVASSLVSGACSVIFN